MRYTDARVRLLRDKVDLLIDAFLKLDLDDVVDNLDHYLLGTLRQPHIESVVFNRVVYYVNRLINTYMPNTKWYS